MGKNVEIDWAEIGDNICEILTVSLRSRDRLEAEAKAMNGTFEGLVAAAITQIISEQIEVQLKSKSH